MKIIDVPHQFREPDISYYPEDNIVDFENWFFLTVKPEEITGRVYLPVFWTSYYKKWSYGQDKNAISMLQYFIGTLDVNVKYFTIVQYDDGILNDLSRLDVRVFSMAKNTGYVLPLICQPHRFRFSGEKKYLANFVGRVTHPIREKMMRLIAGEEGYYMSTENHSLEEYCKVISESVFTLCPRGYGATSFRVMESLQYNSIPVYISDDFLLPHNSVFDYGVSVNEFLIHILPEILKGHSSDREKYVMNGKRAYNKIFTFEANLEYVLENI